MPFHGLPCGHYMSFDSSKRRIIINLNTVKLKVANSTLSCVFFCLSKGTWSTPSAVLLVGMGCGAQLGLEVTDYVIGIHSQNGVTS